MYNFEFVIDLGLESEQTSTPISPPHVVMNGKIKVNPNIDFFVIGSFARFFLIP